MPSLEDNERAADTTTTNLPESSTGTTDTSGDGELVDDEGKQETKGS